MNRSLIQMVIAVVLANMVVGVIRKQFPALPF